MSTEKEDFCPRKIAPQTFMHCSSWKQLLEQSSSWKNYPRTCKKVSSADVVKKIPNQLMIFSSRKACGKGCIRADVKCNSGSICRNKSTVLQQQRLFFTLNHFVELDLMKWRTSHKPASSGGPSRWTWPPWLARRRSGTGLSRPSPGSCLRSCGPADRAQDGPKSWI